VRFAIKMVVARQFRGQRQKIRRPLHSCNTLPVQWTSPTHKLWWTN